MEKEKFEELATKITRNISEKCPPVIEVYELDQWCAEELNNYALSTESYNKLKKEIFRRIKLKGIKVFK